MNERYFYVTYIASSSLGQMTSYSRTVCTGNMLNLREFVKEEERRKSEQLGVKVYDLIVTNFIEMNEKDFNEFSEGDPD